MNVARFARVFHTHYLPPCGNAGAIAWFIFESDVVQYKDCKKYFILNLYLEIVEICKDLTL